MSQTETATQLGTTHGAAGIPPWGGPEGGGAALLMNALGETGPATAANHNRRIALDDAYWDAYRWAAGICFKCGRYEGAEDVNGELLCRNCASEYDAAAGLPSREALLSAIRSAPNGSSLEQLADHILRELGGIPEDDANPCSVPELDETGEDD